MKSNSKAFSLFLFVIIVAWAADPINSPGPTLSSYNTLDSSVTYSITFTLSSSITSGSIFQLQFSSNYNILNSSLTNCQGSTSSLSAVSSTSCSVSYQSLTSQYIVNFNSLFTTTKTYTYLSIQFNVDNPWAQTTQGISVYVLQLSNNIIASGTVYITYVASSMNSCSLSSSSQVTGLASTHTASFIATKSILSNSDLVITLPIWYSVGGIGSLSGSSLSCTGVQNTDTLNPSCSINNVLSSQTIKISTIITTSKTIISAIQIQISLLRNPWNQAPFGPITYQLVNGVNALVSQRCSNVYLTVTTPNVFTTTTFTLPNLGISQSSSTVRIRLTVNNPFPKDNTQLRVTFSSTVGMSFTTINTVTLISQNATQMIFSSFNNNTAMTNGLVTVGNFIVTNPPSSQPFSFRFTTEFIQNGSIYKIDQNTVTYSATVGAVTGTVVTPVLYSINKITSYTISFTISNRLIIGSAIHVLFPAQLSVSISGGCSSNLSSLACSVLSTSNITLSVTGNISAAANILLTVPQVTNGPQSKATSTFQIYTYYISGSFDTLVDRVNSGITVTLTANLINSTSIAPTSNQTFITTSYTFNILLTDIITTGGYISITFPSEITPITPALGSANFPTATCTLNTISAQSLSITGCFPSSSFNNLTLIFAISGIRNPNSLQPTSTFTIQTYSASTLTNYINSGLIITMQNATLVQSLTVTPTLFDVRANNIYTILITHKITNHNTNDFLILTLPSTMTYTSTPTCLSQSGISSVSCFTFNSSNGLNLTYSGTISSTLLRITINSINNYDIGDTPVTFLISIYNSNGYLMEYHQGISLTYQQIPITSFSINNDSNIAINQLSNLTITLSTPFSINSAFSTALTALIITIPPQVTIGSSCGSSSGTCTVLSSTQYKISSIGTAVTNVSISLPNVLLPSLNPSSTSFQLQYTYDNNNVSVLTSGLTISTFCRSPCQRCSVLNTNCMSCLPAPNNLTLYDPQLLQCVSVCAPGKYANNATKQCVLCNSPCSNCTSSVDCASCVSNTWLSSLRCVAVCPNTFYNDSSGVCLSCQSPCVNCLTISSCLSCINPTFYTNFSCVNASNCPNGTFPNTTTFICQSCQSPCLTCSLLSNNCTSCVNTSFSYNNTCYNLCPTTTFPNSPICSNCVNPCVTCSSLTFCISCNATTYLSTNGTCVVDSSCPSGTYPNATTRTCANCPSGCTQCSTSTNCTLCSTPLYFFYNNTCITICPNGTFKSSVSCVACGGNCSSCQNSSSTCLTCISPQLLFLNTCVSNCPNQYFSDNITCQQCKSTCLTCSNSASCTACNSNLYMDSSNNCVSTCPFGYYENTTTNKCTACTPPCSSCSAIPTNCSSCSSPKIYYLGNCVDSCPSSYFNVSGFCITCPNCLNCYDATTCLACRPLYYYYAGVCYSQCPSFAPIEDSINNKCGACDSRCYSCAVTARNCTSCYGGEYLFRNDCLGECPAGYIPNVAGGNCIEPLIGRLIFVPCSLTVLAFCFILLYSGVKFWQTTQILTIGVAVVSLCQLISWFVLTLILMYDVSLPKSVRMICMNVGIVVVVVSVLMGVGYVIWVYWGYGSDRTFSEWRTKQSCVCSYRVINSISCLTLRFFRFIYGGLFQSIVFNAFFSNYESFFSLTSKLSLVSLGISTMPMVGVCAALLYYKQIYDQTFYCVIDTLILGCISCIITIIDSNKSKEYLEGKRNKLPYCKYSMMEGESMFDIMRQFISEENERGKPLTQVSQAEKDKIFKNIKWLDNLNKYGHLNIIQNDEIEERKSLPEISQLHKMKQYDPLFHNRNKMEDQVINDIFFEDQLELERLEQERLKEEEDRRRRELQLEDRRRRELQLEIEKRRIQEEKQKQIERQLEIQRLKREEEIERERLRKLKEQQEERIRLLKKLQDEEEQVNLQFPDIAIIDRHQNQKNKDGGRKSPLKFLANCGKTQDKTVDQKALKKLKDLSNKNGLDSDFMQETFGVEKHYNIDLLSNIIDKHHGINREAVKQLFSNNNNPEILQQLFGKNSDVDKDKLKQLMNDPQGEKMIKSLTDNEDGILSSQMAKQLLSKDSKYSKEFIKNLLGQNDSLDQTNLQNLLKDSKGKGKESPLKALQKIGGQNLQNKQILNNMLGKEAVLDPQMFTKVANDLSIKAISNLFQNKSEKNDILTKKLLNNKKIPLKNLSTVFEQQELIQQLAKALVNENQNVQQNLINLFKNAEDLDPQILSQILKDPILLEKLLGNPIDPQFLESILKKGSNVDLNLLKETLKQMSDQKIKQIFQFNPQKNVDYKALATLFDHNNRTDPQLVKKLMEPKLILDLYSKGNNEPKRLLKLVQKGSNFDPEVILSIYGKNNNHFLDEKPQNNDAIDPYRKDEYRSEKGEKNNFIHNNNSMSRTDGMMGFLSPMRIINKNKMGIDELGGQTHWQQPPQQVHQQEEEDQGQEIIDDEITKKRKKKKNMKKKQYSDIRLKAQQIYLQRIEAPHEANTRKTAIRKKKQKQSNSNLVMDEDNDFIDLDF